MTNGQVNFVHDLVQMAKAFEELPQVRRELDAAHSQIEVYAKQVQRLELRLIDLKTDLDAAHAATRKAEVERDHAEQMFLETDDRLNAFQRLLRSFQADAGALVKAAEPAPAEQVSVPAAQAEAPTTPEPVAAAPATPAPASGVAEFHGYVGNVDSVSSGPQGQRAEGEHTASETMKSVNTVPVTEGVPAVSEGVSVPLDPTPVSASSSETAWHGSTEAGDDVGYHNEPNIKQPDGTVRWEAWDDWSQRMNARYGINNWPVRSEAAQ